MYEVKRRERRVINWIRKWIYEFMHMEWREFDGWEDKLSRVKRRCFPSSPLRHKSRDPPRRPSCSRRSARASPADWTCTAPPPAGTEEGEWSMVWAGSWRTSAGVYLIFRPERLEQWSSPQVVRSTRYQLVLCDWGTWVTGRLDFLSLCIIWPGYEENGRISHFKSNLNLKHPRKPQHASLQTTWELSLCLLVRCLWVMKDKVRFCFCKRNSARSQNTSPPGPNHFRAGSVMFLRTAECDYFVHSCHSSSHHRGAIEPELNH